MIPALTIRQHKKSIKITNNKTPPIAIPIIAAEERAGESTRMTRSEPIVKIRIFLLIQTNHYNSLVIFLYKTNIQTSLRLKTCVN